MSIQKPFLKWVGGKTQLIDRITGLIPKKINNYHEPFLGGGSVLFAVLSLQKQGKITISGTVYAYDINKHLINLYTHIQNNKDELFKYVEEYRKEYDDIKTDKSTDVKNRIPSTITDAKQSKESYYYWMRELYRDLVKQNSTDISDSVRCSALFLVINKTCFRGIYREGPNGFNVPFGNYKKTPVIITKVELDKISELISNVKFIHKDFSESLACCTKKGDFVYMDPPYAPENDKSFVKYVSDGFTIEMHNRLFEMIKNLNRGVKFVLSNSNVKIVLDHFDNDKLYKIDKVEARRAINSKNPASKATEIIIYSLP